ncbi:hypothetical protein NDU88_004066 [Pleurodeles waltl]|uniref:Uncharacterized protein n=1 Tax=Pleurodeles waltl TaxID=8319 RepID=A0AAV7PEI2_PLEWA|nr:hypothetical protein NDU88_004066 [Pleurodeles waltl]
MVGCVSRRLRTCRADLLRSRERQLCPPARPLLPRRVAVFPAFFNEPPLQGSGLGVFRKPPEQFVIYTVTSLEEKVKLKEECLVEIEQITVAQKILTAAGNLKVKLLMKQAVSSRIVITNVFSGPSVNFEG